MFRLDFGIWNVLCFKFFKFIVIISLICSDNSKTLSFSFLPFYCLAFDFSSWLPFWYLQTFFNSILSRGSLRLTYNEFYSIMIYFVFVDILDFFLLVFSLLHCIIIMKPLHRCRHSSLLFRFFVFFSSQTLIHKWFGFPIFQYSAYLMKIIPETCRAL
jgi:hypothetical protein